MEETRKIGDYSVKYSMYIGHKDIALGENPNADKDERYMCCFVETNAIFERYSGVLVSDDFAEIAKVFGQRVADAAEEIIQENERACQEVGMNEELTTNSCKPISYEDSIENKVVVVKDSILRPEFRHANHQLMKCPICGTVNRSLDLDETDGWMECESCHNAVQILEYAKSRRVPVYQMADCNLLVPLNKKR